MDPNANLKRQLEIAKQILNETVDVDDVSLLAELVVSLDEWITCGGFLPERWRKVDV